MTPCPCCGNKRAYVGFTTVECPTPTCRNYNGAMDGTEENDSGEDTWWEIAYAAYMKRLISP